MLDELKTIALLRGVRGEPPVDFPALAETISRFGQLAVDCPDLTEMELNPLVATPTGVVAVDARATLACPGQRPRCHAHAPTQAPSAEGDLFWEPAHFVMERRMLLGVKAAGRTPGPRPAPAGAVD